MTSSPIQAYLERLLAELEPDRSGTGADYIPELAAADPERLGIALATVDGAVYVAGDHDTRFSIQSMSKPFTYALALGDRGLDVVDEHVGLEPTGDAFNSISLEADTGRPRNPMINAGAIIATSLVTGDRDARILDLYSRCAGRPLDVHEPTFLSERETGHRNRAIGHMLRAVGVLDEDPTAVLDAYFRQCAVSVDCRDVALMAATLANGGTQPLTNRPILDRDHVRRVLSVMTTCGMYDGAGDWLVGVGLPAKSGVAGGVLAVLPGQLGLCVFSPRLDAVGNSVRGVAGCRRISKDLGLHFLDVASAGRATIRARFHLGEISSTRRRPAAEREALAGLGQRCVIYELQGDLVFGALERVVRDVVAIDGDMRLVVLDLVSCSHLDAAAQQRLLDLAAALRADGRELVIVTTPGGPVIASLRTFATRDAALEWCEWRLLGLDPTLVRDGVTLETHPLTAALTDAQRETLAGIVTQRSFAIDEVVVSAGDPAEEVLLLLSGELVVKAGDVRLSTLLPGAVVGEASLLGSRVRSADVVADRGGEVLALSTEAFDGLAQTDPELQAALLRTLLTSATEIVTRLTRQVEALS